MLNTEVYAYDQTSNTYKWYLNSSYTIKLTIGTIIICCFVTTIAVIIIKYFKICNKKKYNDLLIIKTDINNCSQVTNC